MTNPSFPQWTTKIAKGKDVVGEDMLGIEGAAQSYQQALIPGIISTTDRARYYSFYAWVLYRFINFQRGKRLLKNFRGKYFKRHEVALILGAYSHHLGEEPLRGLIGAGTNYNKVSLWWDENNPVSLDVGYFKNKLGGFGQYYFTVMQALEIVLDSEQPSWVYRLTKSYGEPLAKAFERSISNTTYFKKLSTSDELESLTHKDSVNYGKAACICADALNKGDDLPLLRDAFFRFDQVGSDNPHVFRRLSLAVAMDLVRGAKGKFDRDLMLRPALYLGEYSSGLNYKPLPELDDWALRWKMVSIRHQYTFGLQALWGAFILKLRDAIGGISFAELMQWLRSSIGADIFDKPLSKYLDARCGDVSLKANWQKSYREFSVACRQSSQNDEYSLYLLARSHREDPDVLLRVGIQTLTQHYLRFLPLYQNPTGVWMEMAKRERLPLISYYQFVGESLSSDLVLGNWLEAIYRDFILGQHEFIALQKLRYQNYDTFKFYHREGRFYWPFRTPKQWREPIRLAGNRLRNALSILTDLGLVEEDSLRQLSLTKDGREYLTRTIELRSHDN